MCPWYADPPMRTPSLPLKLLSTAVVLLLAAIALAVTHAPNAALPALDLERVFPALTFERPVLLTHAGDGSNRVYVVEQHGVVHRIDAAAPGRTDAFLDIRSRVSRGGNEEGMLGLAFDPGFAANGRFYVYYSAASPRRSVLSRFETGSNGLGDAASESVLLEVRQPYSNHNGGMIAFGPDGMLYVALGDGGSAGDPQRNGQDLGTLLGAILRIDVTQAGDGAPYAIPDDNPFVGQSGARGEIWAYGLRNPWRFSFDSETGDLWTGDVGQNALEEVDVVRRGGNYGWNVMEGSRCFRSSSCTADDFEPPVAEYGRDLGCSITGGYVYRGQRLPELRGVYLYADYCSGRIWGLRHDGERVTEQAQLARASFQDTVVRGGRSGRGLRAGVRRRHLRVRCAARPDRAGSRPDTHVNRRGSTGPRANACASRHRHSPTRDGEHARCEPNADAKNGNASPGDVLRRGRMGYRGRGCGGRVRRWVLLRPTAVQEGQASLEIIIPCNAPPPTPEYPHPRIVMRVLSPCRDPCVTLPAPDPADSPPS